LRAVDYLFHLVPKIYGIYGALPAHSLCTLHI